MAQSCIGRGLGLHKVPTRKQCTTPCMLKRWSQTVLTALSAAIDPFWISSVPVCCIALLPNLGTHLNSLPSTQVSPNNLGSHSQRVPVRCFLNLLLLERRRRKGNVVVHVLCPLLKEKMLLMVRIFRWMALVRPRSADEGCVLKHVSRRPQHELDDMLHSSNKIRTCSE